MSWGVCGDPEGSNLPRHVAVVNAAEQLIASLLRSGRMSPAAAFRLSALLIESGDVEGGIGLIKIGQDLLDAPQRERCGTEAHVSCEGDIVY
jgi:hypothetical protein